jgi:hypothetical protein
MRGRAAILITLLTGVALFAAGCGSSDGMLQVGARGAGSVDTTGPSPALLQTAAQRTIALDTGKASVDVRIENAPNASGPVTLHADVQFDAAKGTASATSDLSPLAALLGGDNSGGNGSGAERVLGALLGQVQVVVADGTVYVKPGTVGQLLNGGKPWFKADGLEKATGNAIDLQGIDPNKLLDELRNAGGTVTEVGPADVRGVATTQYHATFTPQNVSGVSGPVELDVWIDGDGIVRKVSSTATYDDVKLTASAELFDLGKPVSVQAPPADQVSDASALLGLIEQLTR